METITSISKVREQLPALANNSRKKINNPVIVVQKSEPVLAIIAYAEYLELKKLKELNNKMDYTEPTPAEMLLHASHLFNVNSQPDPDDDNIADPSKLKPISF